MYLQQLRPPSTSFMTEIRRNKRADQDRWKTTHPGNVKELRAKFENFEFLCDPRSRAAPSEPGLTFRPGAITPVTVIHSATAGHTERHNINDRNRRTRKKREAEIGRKRRARAQGFPRNASRQSRSCEKSSGRSRRICASDYGPAGSAGLPRAAVKLAMAYSAKSMPLSRAITLSRRPARRRKPKPQPRKQILWPIRPLKPDRNSSRRSIATRGSRRFRRAHGSKAVKIRFENKRRTNLSLFAGARNVRRERYRDPLTHSRTRQHQHV